MHAGRNVGARIHRMYVQNNTECEEAKIVIYAAFREETAAVPFGGEEVNCYTQHCSIKGDAQGADR